MQSRDWKSIAAANGLTLKGKELEAIIKPLEALDAVFRPLASRLTPEIEPALVFRAEADAE